MVALHASSRECKSFKAHKVRGSIPLPPTKKTLQILAIILYVDLSDLVIAYLDGKKVIIREKRNTFFRVQLDTAQKKMMWINKKNLTFSEQNTTISKR